METSAPSPSFFFGRRTGAPLVVSGVELAPESLVLLVHWRNFGYVWNWPLAVNVRRGAGAEQRIPVVDATRLALWSLGLAAVAMALGFRFLAGDKPIRKEVTHG
jgi:hypothetical protein